MPQTQQQILFTVGPTQQHEYVLEQGRRQLPYFRTADFSDINREIADLFRESIRAGINTEVFFLTCSGTGAMEAMVCNFFDRNSRVLIINGGSFGARFVEIAAYHSIPYEQIELDAGKALDSHQLAVHENEHFDGLLVNMHETSTGVLYDMNMLKDFCRRKKMLLCVDAVSSYLTDPIDFREMEIDALITSTQKALALDPGTALVALSEKALKKIKGSGAAPYYFDFSNYIKNMTRGQTPFTPAVGIHLQILVRLRALKQYGFDNEIKRVALLAEHFRNSIQSLPLRILAEKPSNALTSLVTRNTNAQLIYDELVERFGFFVNPNGGHEGASIFRVGHMGDISCNDLDRLVDSLKVLNSEGKL